MKAGIIRARQLGYSQFQRKLMERNLNPHQAAVVAMWLWGREYAHEFGGGAMDFWDSLDSSRKKTCLRMLDDLKRVRPYTGKIEQE